MANSEVVDLIRAIVAARKDLQKMRELRDAVKQRPRGCGCRPEPVPVGRHRHRT